MKKLVASKTFWVGVCEIVAGIALLVQGSLEAGVPVTIIGILKIILRVVTKEPVGV